MKKLKKRVCINVTQECIDGGIPEDSAQCAVAQAFASNTRPMVNHEEVYFVEDGRYWCANTSPRMRKFLEAFDTELPVVPSKFYLTFEAL